MIVVEIEAAVQAEARIENRGSDDCAGYVSVFLHDCRQRGLIRSQFVSCEIVHSAECRIGPRENHRVRRQGDRHSSVCPLKTNAIGSKRIDIWSPNLLVSVTPEMIGA